MALSTVAETETLAIGGLGSASYAQRVLAAGISQNLKVSTEAIGQFAAKLGESPGTENAPVVAGNGDSAIEPTQEIPVANTPTVKTADEGLTRQAAPADPPNPSMDSEPSQTSADPGFAPTPWRSLDIQT